MRLDLPAVYLFGRTACSVLDRFLDRSTLFAFDLDGTLAPIVSDPDAAGISGAVREELSVLAGMAPVAIITGRSRPDALRAAFRPGGIDIIRGKCPDLPACGGIPDFNDSVAAAR